MVLSLKWILLTSFRLLKIGHSLSCRCPCCVAGPPKSLKWWVLSPFPGRSTAFGALIFVTWLSPGFFHFVIILSFFHKVDKRQFSISFLLSLSFLPLVPTGDHYWKRYSVSVYRKSSVSLHVYNSFFLGSCFWKASLIFACSNFGRWFKWSFDSALEVNRG